jgi:hypothetical protein
MKFKITLIVFCEGERQGEIDVLAQFNTTIDALRAVAQLGAANSLLFHHPDMKAILADVPSGALARLHEKMGEGVVVQIKDVAEYHPEIPEELRRDPELMYHVIVSRPRREIPPEGIIDIQRDGQIH